MLIIYHSINGGTAMNSMYPNLVGAPAIPHARESTGEAQNGCLLPQLVDLSFAVASGLVLKGRSS